LPESLAEIRDSLLYIEEDLRKLATDIQFGAVSRETVMSKIGDIIGDLYGVNNRLYEVRSVVEESVLETLSEATYFATRAAEKIYDALEKAEEVNPAIDSDIEQSLNDLEEAVKKLTGSSCRYRISNRLKYRILKVCLSFL